MSSEPGRLLRLVEWGLRLALRLGGVSLRQVSTSVGQICVYDWRGTPGKPTVVLLHGIVANSTSWWPLFFGLRRSAGRIFAMDNLGHGWSDAPAELEPEAMIQAVEEVLRAEIAEPAVVLGNSLGGALALHFAAKNPERVKNLLLVSPAGAPWTEAEITELRALFDLADVRAATAFVDRLYAKPVAYARLIAPEILRRFRDPAIRHLVSRFRTDQAMTPESMAVIPAPSLLLWGRKERLLPNTSLHFFRAHLRGVVEEPLEWGHCPQLDRQGELVARVRRWVEEGR